MLLFFLKCWLITYCKSKEAIQYTTARIRHLFCLNLSFVYLKAQKTILHDLSVHKMTQYILFDLFLPSGVEEPETPRVVNVILPEHRGYFMQHLGYFLATFLLLAFIVVAVIVLTRRRKKRGTATPMHSMFLTCFQSSCLFLRFCVSSIFQGWSTSCADLNGKT